MENAAWSEMDSKGSRRFLYFHKRVTRHSTIGNKYRRQKTLTGSIQDNSQHQKDKFSSFKLPEVGEQERPLILEDEANIWSSKLLSLNIEKCNVADLFPKFQMLFETNQTKLALKRDIYWCLCAVVNDVALLLLGSSTRWYPM